MNVDVERIRVTCRANGVDAPRALAARARMAAAARSLPAALDRALGEGLDVGDRIVLDRITAALDFDPLEHDAETVAALWADRIQAALRAALAARPSSLDAAAVPRPAPAAVDAPLDATGARAPAPPARDEIAALVRQLLRAGPAALALTARRLAGDTDTLGRLRRLLSPDERFSLARALTETAGDGPTRPSDRSAASDGRELEPRRAPARRDGPLPASAAGGEAAEWSEQWASAAQSAPDAPAPPDRAAAEQLSATIHRAAQRSAPPAGEPGPAITRAGGLALLYPWLGEHLTSAAEGTDLELVDARRLALAALVDPDDPLAQHDPLVRLLAGAPADARTAHLDQLGDVGDVAAPTDARTAQRDGVSDVTAPSDARTAQRDGIAAADRLLRGFAQLLAGLESATPDWLRAQLMRRPGELSWPAGAGAGPGRLGDGADAVHLKLAASPFDPLLARLPYPLGPFRLPWTPPLQLTIEAR